MKLRLQFNSQVLARRMKQDPRNRERKEGKGNQESPAVQEASPNPETDVDWAEDDVEERGGDSSVSVCVYTLLNDL